jgi:light-regulated signal transduction histidine kinase (bacteriophytochrome)
MSNLELKQTSAQLEISNQELESFSYSVSHDLRAPLRAINGFSQILLEDYGDRFDDDCKDYFSRIQRNVDRMGTLIDDLLLLSRISRSEMRYDKVNLSELVQEISGDIQALQPERIVDLSVVLVDSQR